MNKQILLNELVRSELERYTNLYDQFKISLEKLPKGSIIVRNGRYSRYTRENGKASMRKITDATVLKELRRKRFVKIGIPILQQRIEMCEEFLRKDIPNLWIIPKQE